MTTRTTPDSPVGRCPAEIDLGDESNVEKRIDAFLIAVFGAWRAWHSVEWAVGRRKFS